MVFSQASSSSAVGSEGCAPSVAAANAPAAHARRSASSCGRPSSSATDEAGRERVAGAGAVDRDDRRRRGAGDLLPSSNSTAPLGAVGDRDELAARDDLVLEPVDDEQVGLELDLAAPAPRSARRTTPCAAAASTTSSGTSSWQSTAPVDRARRQLRVRARERRRSRSRPPCRRRSARRPVCSVALELELDAGRDEPGARLVGEARRRRRRRSSARSRRAAPPRPPGSRPCRRGCGGRRARDGLARPRQPLDARDEVEVDRPDDGELDCHAGARLAVVTRRARAGRPARGRAGSRAGRTARPRASRGRAPPPSATDGGEPSSARTSTASSR